MVHEFVLLAKCTGLFFHPAKCQFVLPHDRAEGAFRKDCREKRIRLRSSKISRAGLYLGVFLGLEGVSLSWQGPCRALLRRARYVKSLCLGLAGHIHMYNVYCQPVLQHVAQLYPITDTVRVAEREALQQLPVAPRFSLSSAILCDLKLFGITCEARAVEPSARAALFRAALRSDEFAHGREYLEEFTRHDGCELFYEISHVP
eukprot:8188025-Pyramimonas_sp.AAC.1